MVKTSSLVAKLAVDYPDIHFIASDDFRWSPDETTIYYDTKESAEASASLLHETGHALCGHAAFTRDINLIKMEREAWDKALELSARYRVDIDMNAVEDMLDTYRDWLHARSTCPVCSLTGVQTDDHQYRCLSCSHEWRVNDARRCALRRYSLIN